ncbi:hypothetical protein GYH30_007578 [Glycine max]|nr:hypothetical protein GYH30_007578 [Glycine max]
MAKTVEELKSELIIRKSSRAHQVLDYFGNIGMECCKMSGRDDEIMLKQTKSELRDNNVKFWNLPVNDNGECETSALTEDSDPLVLEMDQLEAELEFDQLQKLPGHPVDTNFHEEIRPKLDEKNQIAELESELNVAQSKLQEKEAELQALKNCITLLSELPLSTVSGKIMKLRLTREPAIGTVTLWTLSHCYQLVM